MSFDLGIFSNFKGVTAEKVKKAYSDPSAEWETTERFTSFSKALFKNHPQLKDCSDEQIDLSPWAHTELCDGYMVLGFVSDKNKSDKAFGYVLRLAEGFGLVVFDPQGGEVSIRGKVLKD